MANHWPDLVYTLPILVVARDTEGALRFWSRECELTTGFSRAQMEGNPDWLTLLGLAPDQFPLPLDSQTALVCAFKTTDDTKRYISWRGADIKDGQHWYVGTDITEAYLREAHAQLTIEQLSDGVLTLDHDLAITAINTAGARIIGIDPVASIGERLFELFPDAKGTQFEVLFEEALKTQREYSFDEYYAGRGPTGWYSIRIHPLGPAGIAILFTNITARKEEEAILRESEEQFRSLIQNTEVSFARVTPDGEYLFITPGSTHFSLGLQEALRKAGPRGLLEFIVPEDRHLFEQLLEIRFGRSKEPIEIEMRVEIDGVCRTLLEKQVPVLDEAGDVTSYDLLVIDVTAQREMTERMRQAQRLGAIGAVAGRIAHEFNNLLTAIVGNVTLAQDDVEPDNPIARRLNAIEMAANRATVLTRQLLAFTKKQQPKRALLPIGQPVSDAIAEAQQSAPVSVVIRAEGLVDQTISMDRDQMSLLFANLITNGVEAISGAGEVVLAITQERVEDRECLRVVVSDTGAGMSRDVLERALDPFYTTKNAVEGAGLGLTVSAGIAKQHGGWLEVKSEPGKGTEVTVYLPLPQIQARRTKSASSATGATVLIVDDEQPVRLLAADFLQRAGIETICVGSGKEALARLGDTPGIGLVLLDLMMPTMTGRETLEHIRESLSDLPVVVVTGYSTDDHTELRALGVEMILPKPFSASQLVEAVRNGLAARV